MLINIEKLESVLVKNWTEFIDARQLLKYVSGLSNRPVRNLTISRFEPQNNGFLVWLDYKILDSERVVNITQEIFLGLNGDVITLQHLGS